MTIHEIENLSHADLKAQRVVLLKLLKAVAPEEVAARYLQARTDAKLRDEKLAEQAKLLAVIQEGQEAMKQREAAAAVAADELAVGLTNEIDDLRSHTKELEKAKVLDDRAFADTTKGLESQHTKLVELHEEVLNVTRDGFNSEKEVWGVEKDELGDRIADLSHRCDRLKYQALKNNEVLSSIAKASADVLAATAIEAADKGE